MEENLDVDEQEEEEKTCIHPKLHNFYFLSGADLRMDFAYSVLTFFQLRPPKLLVPRGGRAGHCVFVTNGRQQARIILSRELS